MIMGKRPEDGITYGSPFPRGTGGSNCFRIPALVTLPDGTLVAAADARWNTTFDGGGLDTLVSRSEDKGKTWHYTFANYLGDNGNVYNGAGSTCFIDPTLAVTAEGTVYLLVDLYPYGVALNGSGNTQPVSRVGFDPEGRLLLSADNHKTYGSYLDGNSIFHQDGSKVPGYSVDGQFNLYRDGEKISNLFFADSPYQVVRTGFLYLTKSTDRGATWSEPVLLNVKREDEMVCLAAPGRGLVTGKGRLIFPVYSYNGSAESQRMSFLASWDGEHWERSADFSGAVWSSESAAVELEDGTLRFFYRNGTSHLCYVDYDPETDTWGDAVVMEIATNSNCQISAISLRGNRQVILVSCPTGPNGTGSNVSHAAFRRNGRVFAFAVEKDRSLRKAGSFALTDREAQFMYSCLTELPEGNIAILYEDGETRWGTGEDCYYTMAFRKFPLSEVLALTSE